MSEGSLTKEDIAKDPRLVALVSELRDLVRRATARGSVLVEGGFAGHFPLALAWRAVAYVALHEAARHGSSYAAITTMAYRAFRDQEERDVRRGG